MEPGGNNTYASLVYSGMHPQSFHLDVMEGLRMHSLLLKCGKQGRVYGLQGTGIT